MIVLHIGLRKSGSSSIQAFFAQNADALRAMSVDYPLVGRNRRETHIKFAYELLGQERFQRDGDALADLIEYRRSTGAAAKALVLSTEMFERLPADAIMRLRDLLAGLDEPVTVVLIIRDLISLMPSSYAQKVRYGHKKYSFDRFFEKRSAEDRVDYFATAKRWADVFGRDSLKTIALNPRLIETFAAAAGLPPEITTIPQPGVVNASSGWRVLEAMRAVHRGAHSLTVDHPISLDLARCAGLNRVQARPHEIHLESAARDVGEAMGWMKDKGLFMTLEQAQWCAKTYDDAVAAMNAHFNYDLPLETGLASRNFVARAFLPEASMIPAGELRAFYDAVGERIASDRSATYND